MPCICLVDDDPGIRKSLCRLLTFEGFEVVEFASGDHFLREAAHASADLILSDVNMPGTDGLQMTRCLRDQGVTTPILLISGNRETGLQEALAAGANGFTAKPFDFRDLFHQLQTLLKTG